MGRNIIEKRVREGRKGDKMRETEGRKKAR